MSHASRDPPAQVPRGRQPGARAAPDFCVSRGDVPSERFHHKVVLTIRCRDDRWQPTRKRHWRRVELYSL